MNDIKKLVENLKLRCADVLPGEMAQQQMLAIPRVKVELPNSEEHAIPSAVLILLFKDNNQINFFLTERTEMVQHHKGQISLPGGTWEKGEHLYETAIRETYEEIGIPESDIKIIAELTPLFVKITGYMIHPFIGYVDYVPKLIPHPGEVNNDFSVPVADLLNPENTKTELWTIRGIPVDVPFFHFDIYKVWGATAMILSEFKKCLEDIT